MEPLLHQLRLRLLLQQQKSCPSKTKTRSSERDLGKLGLPARPGPEARLLGAGGPAWHPEAVSAAVTAVGVAVNDWSSVLCIMCNAPITPTPFPSIWRK